MASITAEEIVQRFGMLPHPEGGFFVEIYKAEDRVPLPRGERAASTAIYFLLTKDTFSRFHRIKSDEVWHFYLGGACHVVELGADGKAVDVTLGQDLRAGQQLVHIVKKDTWFGAYLDDSADFALVGCTVAPGFEFADFEMATRADLLRDFPEARDAVMRLTSADE